MTQAQTETLAKPSLLGAEPQLFVAEPWGACTFVVRDLDGNLILFAGRGE